MKKKILLIEPPFYRLMGSHFNSLPLGLCYIAAVLKENGHEVKVYNADYLPEENYANQRELFEHYDNYKKILNNLSHPIWIEIKEKIMEIKPDVIGISMLTPTYKSAINIAKIAKDTDRDIMVVVGGTHPTLLPEECIKVNEIDFVVVGEGEDTFLELVNGVEKDKIKGLVYKNNEKIMKNEKRPHIKNLDTLPFPLKDCFLNDYKADEYGAIITSRGCPFQCTYCVSKKLWDQKVRFRSTENVMREIKEIYTKYGTRFFNFRDDTLTLNKERTKALCNLIIENNLNIKWTCDTRVDTLDKETLELMKKAGCVRVKMGVESGSDRILQMVKKGITKEQVLRTVKLIKEVGIDFTAYLMIGFPTETEQEVRKTLNFAKQLNPNYYSLSIVSPYYGTEIYNWFVKNNNNEDIKEHWEYFFHQSKDMILTDGISKELVDEFLSLNETEGKSRV